jgi:hypothetical protein
MAKVQCEKEFDCRCTPEQFAAMAEDLKPFFASAWTPAALGVVNKVMI